ARCSSRCSSGRRRRRRRGGRGASPRACSTAGPTRQARRWWRKRRPSRTDGAAASEAPAILPARMHLSALRLRGFKSFPDPVEVRLEPGVAVVVGPNGSGKSNLADALVWAAGSLSPSELRAEHGDDVLFAGSASRPPAASCEVELLFDNRDGTLTELDYTEV